MGLSTVWLMIFLCLISCGNKHVGSRSVQGYTLVDNWPRLPDGFNMGNPTGIDIDTNQNIFVFCRAGRTWSELMPDSFISRKTILMLDRESGKILDCWGSGMFIMPHGLTVDNHNNIWVTDVGLHQVFKFTHDGRLLMKLGIEKVAGNDSLHFNLPTDVAVAPDGSFYVSDGYGNSRVVKFSSGGRFLFSWGSKGDKPGEFNLPHAIDLDSEGNVYVADRENRRIQKFDAGGKFLRQWQDSGFGKMYALALDRRNRLTGVDYFSDSMPRGSDILVFDANGDMAAQFGKSGHYSGPVCRYHDVAVDRGGNIYASDILGNVVQKFRKK